jgi:hypothetical protein
VLAAVGVERRGGLEPIVDAESLITNSTSGTSSGQLSLRSLAKERSTSAITPLTRSTLLAVLWW